MEAERKGQGVRVESKSGGSVYHFTFGVRMGRRFTPSSSSCLEVVIQVYIIGACACDQNIFLSKIY